VETAAGLMGLKTTVLKASTSDEINAAFATLERERPVAIFVAPDAFFTSRRVQLALLGMLHRIPTIHSIRPFVEAGGLMSYGTNLTDAYRQTGSYTGRILNGAKPADLPIVRPTKFELVINTETARLLGLTVPPTLLARADEVIE
jgi:putative ABC transport system substrate-binding protein